MKDLVRILSHLAPYRGRVAVALTATLLTVGVNLVVPLLTARIIDDGIAAGDTAVVGTSTAMMLGLVVAGIALSAVAAVVAVRRVLAGTRRPARPACEDPGAVLPELDELDTGELLVRLTSDVTRVQQLVMFGLSFLAQAPLMLVGALVLMLTLRPDLADPAGDHPLVVV